LVHSQRDHPKPKELNPAVPWPSPADTLRLVVVIPLNLANGCCHCEEKTLAWQSCIAPVCQCEIANSILNHRETMGDDVLEDTRLSPAEFQEPPSSPAINDDITIRQILKEGAGAAWPICLGYFPLGLALGVLAGKAGLHPLQIGLMSVLVFAGSAQFIAVSLLTSGAAMMSIITTTLLVNLRHILMSSSLAVYLRSTNPWFLTLYSYGVTDESFAVNLARFREGSWHRYQALTVNHLSNAAWVLVTILGGYGGRIIPAGAFGIDYALAAMFLCLLVFQLRGRIYAVTAVAAGAAALGLSLVIQGNAYVIIASILAATLGFVLKRRHARYTSIA
jgi:4-azaleucine resistance transporter AzlC